MCSKCGKTWQELDLITSPEVAKIIQDQGGRIDDRWAISDHIKFCAGPNS